MPSNLKKGRDYELKVKKILEAEGWQVYKPAMVKFGDQDIFNQWDLIANHPATRQLLFVQCTSSKANANTRIKTKKLKEFTPKLITTCIVYPVDGKEQWEKLYESK